MLRHAEFCAVNNLMGDMETEALNFLHEFLEHYLVRQIRNVLHGYEVWITFFRKPAEVLSLIHIFVVMDIKMPGLDGHEAARAIRRLEREIGAPRAPILALTANAMAEDRRASAAAGIDEFLAKPFDQARLAEAIERALAASAGAPSRSAAS